jgi:hypothetical protein
MNDIKQIKEKQINDFISNSLNFENPGEISVSEIKNGLKNILGEEPAVSFNYTKDTMISEDGNTKKRIEKLESVKVIYTYQDSNLNIFMPGEVIFYVD